MASRYDKIVQRLQWKEFFGTWVTFTSEGDDQAWGWCPFHETPGVSKQPSFSVNKKTLLFRCHAGSCGESGNAVHMWAKKNGLTYPEAEEEICERFGITMPRATGKLRKVTEYPYNRRDGSPFLRKVRYVEEATGLKAFKWFDAVTGKRGRGGQMPSFYRLEHILKAPTGSTVCLCEGEKKVEAVVEHGWQATCTPDGAGSGKWRHIPKEDIRDAFGGKNVLVFHDLDDAGREFGLQSCAAVHPYAASVKLITLPARTNLPYEDICDWLHSGGTWEEIDALVAAAPPWHPDPNAPPQRGSVRDYFADPGRTADEIEDVLLENWERITPPIFVRSGGLYRLSATTGHLTALARENVTEIVSKHAEIYREDEDGDFYPCELRDKVVDTFMARADWRLPHLDAVVYCPFVDWDGNVVATPGYNRRARVWLFWDGPPLRVGIHLTRQHAKDALYPLLSLFDECHFIGPPDWASAIAGITTVIQRPMLPKAPMFGVTAPTPGTGKSYLVHLCSIVGTGKTAKVETYHARPEELEKLVITKLLAGDSIFFFDNVSPRIDVNADILCQMLTEPRLSRRTLGSLSLSEAPTTATVFATGNNLSIAGDLLTRAVIVQLDPRCADPETLVFKRDGIAWAFSNRHMLVEAALTIVAAYARAGYPGARMDSRFPEWSKMVRSALIWAGLEDCVRRTATAKAASPVFRLIAAWWAKFGGEKNSCARLVQAAETSHDDFRDVLAELLGSKLDAKRLQTYLRGHKGRQYGDKVIDQVDGKWFVCEASSRATGQTMCGVSAPSPAGGAPAAGQEGA